MQTRAREEGQLARTEVLFDRLSAVFGVHERPGGSRDRDNHVVRAVDVGWNHAAGSDPELGHGELVVGKERPGGFVGVADAAWVEGGVGAVGEVEEPVRVFQEGFPGHEVGSQEEVLVEGAVGDGIGCGGRTGEEERCRCADEGG